MSWPDKESRRYLKLVNEFSNKLQEESKKLLNHFGDSVLYSSWVKDTFDIIYYVAYPGATELLIDAGACENCVSYVGVSSVKRKMFHVPVISSYCKIHQKGVKPVDVCQFWNPNSLTAKIIEIKLHKLHDSLAYVDWKFKYECFRNVRLKGVDISTFTDEDIMDKVMVGLDFDSY